MRSRSAGRTRASKSTNTATTWQGAKVSAVTPDNRETYGLLNRSTKSHFSQSDKPASPSACRRTRRNGRHRPARSDPFHIGPELAAEHGVKRLPDREQTLPLRSEFATREPHGADNGARRICSSPSSRSAALLRRNTSPDRSNRTTADALISNALMAAAFSSSPFLMLS